MAVTLRADLNTLPAYKAGQKLQSQAGLKTFKLSSNENPFPPLPSVLTAISQAAETLNRYPDPLNTELSLALATKLGVSVDELALSTGSVALLGNLLQSVAGPGDEVVYAWRSFEAYPIWAQIVGATSVQVPLTDSAEHDLDAMVAAVTDRTRAVIFCTPNNPTGTTISASALRDAIAKIPNDVLVVIDEAYFEFVRGTDALDGLTVFREFDNVAVLRTFSKAYGLAGLRVGYAVAPLEVADFLRRTALPFGVSSLAQAAALASLAAESELFQRVDELVIERERVVSAVRSSGWEVAETQANFFWLPTNRVDEIKAACEAVGVAVRPFPEGLRISIGEREANDRILQVLSDLH